MKSIFALRISIANWWLPFTSGVVACTPLFAGIYEYDSCDQATKFCTWLGKFQWETLSAGLFGLTGGLAVIAATRSQIRFEAEKQVASQLSELYDVLLHVENIRKVALEQLDKLTKLGEVSQTSDGIRNFYNFVRGDGPTCAKAARDGLRMLRECEGKYLDKKRDSFKLLQIQAIKAVEAIKARSHYQPEIPTGSNNVGDPNAYEFHVAENSCKTIIEMSEVFRLSLLSQHKKRVQSLLRC
ncbi:hypothetical protein [Thalassospira lucentensis]|uniref:hypothetical protein n=1 Tax=Thalassospira lucentensis TaxID=168935 RepID=UPI00399D6302